MTALADLLIRRIAATGPITLADYMAECLLHPEHGYYTTATPFGAGGDFTTAPEISQMFGELLGLCLAQAWLDRGAPERFVLAELGPGRGTLMADVLRATRGVPGFHAAADLWLVEASGALRAQQRRALTGHPAQWAEQVAGLPEGPVFLIANEFFDALPIRQFTRQGDGWAETVVGLVEGRLALGRAAALPLAALAHRLGDTEDGMVVETCPMASPIAAEIARRITGHGGAALLVDYGGWRSLGDTFQAVARHEFATPLESPGQADLTAHVDFEALVRAAAPCHFRYSTQGDVLTRLGIAARAERLAMGLSGAALENHRAATRRLTEPSEMGSLFKMLALFRAGDPPPPGF
jgi:NADH dehydrogenase [ubiquinone] 1 alpha subcomplex assembly factor 7